MAEAAGGGKRGAVQSLMAAIALGGSHTCPGETGGGHLAPRRPTTPPYCLKSIIEVVFSGRVGHHVSGPWAPASCEGKTLGFTPRVGAPERLL